MVTLKNVIDYAETNIDRQRFRVGPYDGMYEYPWQPFVLRIATLTVSEYDAFLLLIRRIKYEKQLSYATDLSAF